nr:MAG: hypothetical protein [Wenzhou bat tapwovirus 1]
MQNIARAVSTSVLSGTILKTGASLAAAFTGAAGIGKAVEWIKGKVIRRRDGDCREVKFLHVTTCSDGIYCACGIKHRYKGHVAFASSIPGLKSELYNIHVHKCGMKLACLHPDCVEADSSELTP